MVNKKENAQYSLTGAIYNSMLYCINIMTIKKILLCFSFDGFTAPFSYPVFIK